MSHAELVEQIKSLQRSGMKQVWWDYCDSQLGGVRDPNKHDDVTLQTFLSQAGQGGAPKPARAKGGCGKGGGMMGGGAYGGGMMGGGGMKGGGGMAMMGGGMAMMGGAQPTDLGAFIKTGQKMAPSFKEAWKAYCTIYGGGINDPSRHDQSYIQGFIEYLGQLGQADMGGGAMMAMAQPAFAAPQKRPMMGMAGGGPPMKKAAGGSSGNDLVDRIKALQRRDQGTKEAWWAYVDEQHGGVRDPARHDASVLQDFLSAYE